MGVRSVFYTGAAFARRTFSSTPEGRRQRLGRLSTAANPARLRLHARRTFCTGYGSPEEEFRDMYVAAGRTAGGSLRRVAGVAARIRSMAAKAELSDYKIVLYVQKAGDWVAEVPAIAGCYALMDTREQALRELEKVFEMIREEYAESGKPMPADRTELLTHA
jgi:predicted RNase H-like HicB family nuclease